MYFSLFYTEGIFDFDLFAGILSSIIFIVYRKPFRFRYIFKKLF